MRSLVLCALISASALAAPPPSSKRVSALIVPLDKGSEALALKAEAFVNEALKEYQGLELKTSDDLFGIIADEEAAGALKRAEQGFEESSAAFDAKRFEDAERKLRATIKEYGKAAPAMKTCGHLCDTVAMYAAVLQARGDVEEAKIATLDLIALSPKFEADRKRFPQDFFALRQQVQSSRNAVVRGLVNVKSRPGGARVFLNGEFQGYTPLTLQALPVGKNLLRLERPGFTQAGALVEISPDDQELSRDLVASSAYKAYDGLLDRLATEALKDKPGTAMSSVASSLKLDRAVIGVVKELEAGGATEFSILYVDFKKQQRLSAKRTTFHGDEYGQLKGEIGRMVNAALNAAEGSGERTTQSRDPLDNKHGTEEWNAEDKGGRSTARDKKKKGSQDPLDGVSGTEDW